jgi:predicted dehydrogenase/threonine dehydrogenase-like Zn-dependent dehydrogenase
MKQLIQNFKTGELYVDEVPPPGLSDGMVLVENRFSLISSGTERGTVKVAQASLLGKAKQRPDLVAQVLQNIRKEGIAATIQKVQTKLDSLKALGYSCAGVVIASLDKDNKFKPGDWVACAGQDYASHAEIVCVPQNLVAHIPQGVSFREASFATLGAIALQGVRQAEPQLGEKVCVIGLGLLGQLTCQLLKANGCSVVGIDLSDYLVSLATSLGVDRTFNRNAANLVRECETFTQGHGFDSVIITAAAPSNDPIELSAELTRKKGKVVVVGAVKMDIPRDPHFYRKELDLRMSCSYGPGRYDVSYEEGGHDYPYAYVRWTEQRNMEAFLALVGKGVVPIGKLITHTFSIDNAVNAYDLVLGKLDEPSMGILLEYPLTEKSSRPLPFAIKQLTPACNNCIAFIGAGSFAQSYLLPNAKRYASLHTVVTTKGITAKNVAEKFGFHNASTSIDEVLRNDEISTVFVATHHNTHGRIVLQALDHGKHVFVEKPLTIFEEELEQIRRTLIDSKARLMVGFNRRFSAAAKIAKKSISNSSTPMVINYRVNAGLIPRDHWTQQLDIGGGRILGECCHFIDLMQFFTGAVPRKVFASSIASHNQKVLNNDNFSATISFSDGSIGNLIYTSMGAIGLPKERVEVFRDGRAVIIDDFKSVSVVSGGKSSKQSTVGKGHTEEIDAFMTSLKSGAASPISFESLELTTKLCFRILDSLATGAPMKV